MSNYVSPTWVNNSAPKLNAANLQALTDCVERSQLLRGSGAPTTSTAGAIGQRYRDDTTGIVYVCKSESSGTYTWEYDTDSSLSAAGVAADSKATGDKIGELTSALVDISVSGTTLNITTGLTNANEVEY